MGWGHGSCVRDRQLYKSQGGRGSNFKSKLNFQAQKVNTKGFISSFNSDSISFSIFISLYTSVHNGSSVVLCLARVLQPFTTGRKCSWCVLYLGCRVAGAWSFLLGNVLAGSAYFLLPYLSRLPSFSDTLMFYLFSLI